MKYYKEGHVYEVIKLYEKIIRLPEWEFREYDKLRKKLENAESHMIKHAKEDKSCTTHE
ncbi:hypothetical protein [Bacillus thuringiensis]|uniref:hypothetical protein n=1 Tax=Bacillus thuringiensis TaxID=1428 RepID=UPI00159C1708|nr:hypothetical protein [Bacillus thuringiensis]